MSYEDAMDATIAWDEAHARAIAAAEERGRLRGLAEAAAQAVARELSKAARE